jgi:hypothetical protein
MRISSAFLACFVVLFAVAGTLPNTASAQIPVAGYTFYGGDAAFADDVALVSGSADFTCKWNKALPGASFTEALAGVDLGRCVSSAAAEGGVIEVSFTDNLAMNGEGPDVLIFELSMAYGPGFVNRMQNFGVSVPVDGGLSPFMYFDPVATAIHECGYGTPCAGIHRVALDLSDFGVPEGELIDHLQLHIYDVGLGHGSADVAVVGALHSAPLGAICEAPVVEALPEPEVFDRGFAGDVRSVRIDPPSERKMVVCKDRKSKKSKKSKKSDKSDKSNKGKKCKKKKVFDEGGVHYSISVADHGLGEVHSASLMVTARDLDLIPQRKTYGRRGRKWMELSETMAISAGGHEIAYLNEDFAKLHGVEETNKVAVTYEIPLDDEALAALASVDYVVDIALEASYVNHKGRRKNMSRNAPEEIAVLFVAEGY